MICDHWRDTGTACKCGNCAIGAYSRPSFGVCLRICKKRVVNGIVQSPTPQAILPADDPPIAAVEKLAPSLPAARAIDDPAKFFDRAVVLTLKRTPERLAQFHSRAAPFNPEIFYAVDGDRVPHPGWFNHGGGAWGCWRSHVRIIEQALMDGVNWLLVMEDDCAFVPDAIPKLKAFLERVPDDAHCLMIGGQQMDDGQTIPICEGIRKVSQCERTHCYALSRSGMKSLYRWWNDASDAHCDWQLGDWQESGVNCYRPDPFIAYQAPNFSTIRWRYEEGRSWDGAVNVKTRKPEEIPVVILRCPANALDSLRRRGVVHTGYWRDERDIDRGLAEALQSANPEQKIAELVAVLRNEVAGFDRAIVGLWHPDVLLSYPGAEIIEGDSADAVEFKIKMYLRRLAGWRNVNRPEVFYHIACMNNWRDVLAEQLELAQSVRLTGRWHVSIVGGTKSEANFAQRQAANHGIDFDIVHMGKLDDYEIPALRAAWEWSKANPTGAVLYLHTKGVSKPGDRNKMLWRRLMQRELIAKWGEHTKALAEYDLIGVDWQDSPTHPHFSGNFWCARSDWLAGLCDPVWFQHSRPGTIIINHPFERMAAEFWIGTKQFHHIKSLVCRNANLWTGDAILQFIHAEPDECSRCGSKTHTVEACPIPADVTVESARQTLIAGGCCHSHDVPGPGRLDEGRTRAVPV